MNQKEFIMNTIKKIIASLILLVFITTGLSAQVLVNNANLVVSGGGALTVSGDLINGAASSLDVQGTLTISGDIDNDQPDLTLAGTVIIDGNSALTGSGSVSFNTLTINSGSVLTIGQGTGEGNHITVSGTLSNQAGLAGLLLANDASLIETTGSIDASCSHIMGGDPSHWHLLASPVAAQTISPIFSDGAFFAWDEASQSFAGFGQAGGYPDWNTVNGGSDDFLPGKGYFAVYADVNLERSFSGVLNQGNISYTLAKASATDETYHGFNLTGNPYPSGIDWKTAAGYTRTDLEEVSTGDNNYAYWVWNPAAGNYGTFVSDGADDSGTNGVSRYIAPKQGFWVKAAVDAGTFSINNTARSHSDQEWLKQGNENPSLIKLQLICDKVSYYDELVVEFNGKDGHVAKFFSSVDEAPELFIQRNEQSNSILRYASIPETAVPVSYKAGLDATYTFQATLYGLQEQDVLLEDKLTGSFTDLHQAGSYSFVSETGQIDDRFALHFNPVGINESTADFVKVYYAANNLVINSTTAQANALIEVFDLRGNKVDSFNKLDQGLNHFPFTPVAGVYIVRVVGDKVSSHKIIIAL
jgi:hypothetical protein